MIESLVVGPIAANCWIVSLDENALSKSGHRPCLVVDPGGDADAIIARLGRRRLQPAIYVLTHGHLDHLAALSALAAVFPADIYIHSADAAYLGPNAYQVHCRDFQRVGAQAFVDEQWQDMPSASRLLADGDPVGPFHVIHTPGHTPGSLCLYDAERGVLISGDTLFSGGVGRTDLPGGDARLLEKSLERLLALPGRTRVLPGHGPETLIERCRV